MTQPINATLPGGWVSPKPVSFTITSGTAAKVLVEPYTPAAAVSTLPPFYGGAALLDLTAASSDSVARDVVLWQGVILTTQDTTNTGVVTLTAQNKLSRTAGSWLTDKWTVGDQVMVFAPPGVEQVVAAIDGIAGTVTAVTALDLTVNGTPFAAGTNILVAASRIVAVGQLFRAAVAINAGNTNAIPNTQLLGNAMDNTTLRTEYKTGADAMLIANLPVAVSALPAVLTLTPRVVARY